MGLRELKKDRTRQQIADCAWTLFADHGFDQVTVADVARCAGVSEATVFNYFPAKDDLFFHRLDEYGARLVAAVSGRAPGVGVLQAFRDTVLHPEGLVAQVDAGNPQAFDRLVTVNRVIAESPTLTAREHLSLTRIADALAAALVAEAEAVGTPSADAGFTARVVSSALLGVHRALLLHVRQAVLDDRPPRDLADRLLRHGTAAFALLENGAADYDPRRA
jgi:AcrR family transcriptional regulator